MTKNVNIELIKHGFFICFTFMQIPHNKNNNAIIIPIIISIYTSSNYSDEEDVAYSDYLNIKVYDLYEDFLKQKIDKVVAKENDDEGSIYDVLSIKVYKEDGKTENQEATLEKFKEALTYYSLNRLKAFHDAVQSCIDIMIQEDQRH